MKKITPQQIKRMPYVEFMAFLDEINRPPGGKDSIRKMVQNCFLSSTSKVLDVGCNTGYCTFEVAHLAKCKVIGIDISSEMIRAAGKMREADPLKGLVGFKVGDGMNLPFADNSFDLAFSGGSTAFIDDKQKAIEEYKRVVKPWGFVADINFFYKKNPPQDLIRRLNNLMGTKIEPWGRDYWLNIYKKCDLENYFVCEGDMKQVSRKEVEQYCLVMADQKKLPESTRKVLVDKLMGIMTLFNENHRYLAYAVFILRKNPIPEQIALFGA